MSQEEIETLQAVYEAISDGDWEAALRDTRPDFEFIPPDQNPIAGTYRGREAVRGFFAELWAAFEEVTIQPEAFLEAGDSIVVSMLLTLSPSGSGAEIQMHITHLWTMCDGRAVRCRVFLEREAALEAAGLSEQDAYADS